MTKNFDSIPTDYYGVLFQDEPGSEWDEVAEQVRRIGYAILDSGYSQKQISQLSEAFERTRTEYLKRYGEEHLRRSGELHMLRAPLSFGETCIVDLASNQNLINVLRRLINGKFILNQQNGVINPPKEKYIQGSWHRDLPYQHYISNIPLAVNALFCLDHFTKDNGATFVLPSTHRAEKFPSSRYVKGNAIQIEASAGQFILLDCMIYHSGGKNLTKSERRAINHVYTIPYFKQQIRLPGLLQDLNLDIEQKELFGFNYQEPASIMQFINNKAR